MEKNRKRLIRLIVFVILLAAFLAGFLVFRAKCKTVSYEIFGNERYKDSEIIDLLVKSTADEYAPVLWLKSKLFSQDEIPFIQYTEIELTGPDSVKIYVYEKSLIGCVNIMGRYMCFDKDGIVCESLSYREEGLPEITGLDFSEIVLNSKLPVENDAIFNSILELSQSVCKYECPVREIHFNTDKSVILYLDNGRALMGKKETYDAAVLALADVYFASDGEKLEYDLRHYETGNGRISAHPYDGE